MQFLLQYQLTSSSQEPIVYKLSYSRHCHASIWTQQSCLDYSITYPLLNFTDYASSLDDFIKEYPLVVIETSGEAVTPDGRQCADSFGKVTFSTKHFDNVEYDDQYICDYEPGLVLYGYFIQIGVGFTNDGRTLFMRPFINGQITTLTEKSLDYGLNVTCVTFHPKVYGEYSVQLID